MKYKHFDARNVASFYIDLGQFIWGINRCKVEEVALMPDFQSDIDSLGLSLLPCSLL